MCQLPRHSATLVVATLIYFFGSSHLIAGAVGGPKNIQTSASSIEPLAITFRGGEVAAVSIATSDSFQEEHAVILVYDDQNRLVAKGKMGGNGTVKVGVVAWTPKETGKFIIKWKWGGVALGTN